MAIAILHIALIAKYFTTDKHFTYYLLSSEGWHFRRSKINPWGRCPIIDLVLVLVLGLECLVLVLVLGLEGQVLVNITAKKWFITTSLIIDSIILHTILVKLTGL